MGSKVLIYERPKAPIYTMLDPNAQKTSIFGSEISVKFFNTSMNIFENTEKMEMCIIGVSKNPTTQS